MRRTLQRFPLLLLPLVVVACVSLHPPPLEPGEEEGAAVPAKDLPDLVFNGKTRKAAKLDMVTVKTALTFSYTSITAVTHLKKPLGLKSNSPRTGVEQKLALITAYLYAYNLPSDGDFHLILGDTSQFCPKTDLSCATTNLLNVEISGRPDNTDKVFKAVRLQFLSMLNPKPQSMSPTYVCVYPPIMVTVWGAPFWDVSHPKGGSGTSICKVNGVKVRMRTRNGWELHPVTGIQ